jgi:hypothetical protein
VLDVEDMNGVGSLVDPIDDPVRATSGAVWTATSGADRTGGTGIAEAGGHEAGHKPRPRLLWRARQDSNLQPLDP